MAAAEPNENDAVKGQTIKAKNARLRLMKERNANYLAEQQEETEADDELTKELKVSTE
jgi:hypothetical protein